MRYGADIFLYTHYKGASFRQTVGGVIILNLCTSSDDALYLGRYIYTKTCKNILKDFRVLDWTQILKFTKGHNCVKPVGGVTVLAG